MFCNKACLIYFNGPYISNGSHISIGPCIAVQRGIYFRSYYYAWLSSFLRIRRFSSAGCNNPHYGLRLIPFNACWCQVYIRRSCFFSCYRIETAKTAGRRMRLSFRWSVHAPVNRRQKFCDTLNIYLVSSLFFSRMFVGFLALVETAEDCGLRVVGARSVQQAPDVLRHARLPAAGDGRGKGKPHRRKTIPLCTEI